MRSKKLIYLLLLLIILTGCKEKTYTVTFDTQGGSIQENVVINKGDTIEDIAVPKKEGYLFVSWIKDGMEYDSRKPITEDIKLTASWIEEPKTINYYTVTFITEEQNEQLKVKENDCVVELKAPEIENYLFLGWYIGDEKFDFNTPITKDISLVAKYELNIVTVKYELDGGFGLALETIKKNTTITIPITPTKEGYKFLKWTLNGKEFSFDTKIKENITLVAVWEKIEHVTITYDTDGGNIIEAKTIEKYSRLDSLPTPEKDGYKFVEWQLDNQSFNIENPIEQNITLKAFYEMDSATTTTEGEE